MRPSRPSRPPAHCSLCQWWPASRRPLRTQRVSSGWCIVICFSKECVSGSRGSGAARVAATGPQGLVWERSLCWPFWENTGPPSCGSGPRVVSAIHRARVLVQEKKRVLQGLCASSSPSILFVGSAPHLGTPGLARCMRAAGERCARARRPTETPGGGNDNVLLSLPVFFACLLKHGARVSATDLTSPLQSGPSVSVRRARDAWLEQSHALPPGNTFV